MKTIIFGYFTDEPLHEELVGTPLEKQGYRNNSVGKYSEFLTENHQIATVSLGEKTKYCCKTFNKVLEEISLIISKKTIWIVDNYITEKCSAEDVIEAIILAKDNWNYCFEKYKTNNSRAEQYTIDLFGKNMEEINEISQKINILSNSISLAKDLGNEPPNKLSAKKLIGIIEEFASKNELKVKRILGKEELQVAGAHAVLAVNAGSNNEAGIICVQYQGNPKSTQSIALVGKGVTFDTGGYSLKTANSIVSMKSDMCGAATAFASFKTAVEYQLPINLVLAVVSTDNMISQNAYLPDDVISTMLGKTVEIVSTDAEGRLILADALTYAQKHYDISLIIDIATLTGAAVMSLGEQTTAVIANNQEIADKFLASTKAVNEYAWQMPLNEIHSKAIRNSNVADLTNKPSDYGAAVSFAAAFIHEFIENQTPWIHLDIAGPAYYKTAKYGKKAGATGTMIKSLLHFLAKN
ncbi:MAG: leucyl aminopeptidase family protein [Culicoidibacterales bacterium]